MRALVVLPTYNEADNVELLSRDVLSQSKDIDVLVVDDNSPDGTGEIVAKAAATEPRLHLLQREGKLGLGTAYLAGFRFGLENHYDCVLTMDCDWSHNPRYLPAILDAMQRGDMAIGSRYIPGGGVENWSILRRILSAWANFYTRTLLGLPVRDCTAGFRCYSREVLEIADPFSLKSSGYSFLEEMIHRVHRMGFRIVEIPIVFESRRSGASKIESHEVYLAAWHVLKNAIHPPPLPPRPGSE